MTRRILLQIIVALLLVTPLALAAEDRQVIGKVVSIDDSTRTFVLLDDQQKRWTFNWGQDTVFLTRPREGLRLRVMFETVPGGTHVVKRVGVPKDSRRRI